MKILFFVIVLVFSVVNAEPYEPKNDGFVLLSLLNDSSYSEVKHFKQTLKNDPGNSLVALDLAKIYISKAKNQNDPRYYGLAEKVIKPWWGNNNHPDILFVQAGILEHDHKFSQALKVLNLLNKSRQSAQVSLMNANIHQILGQYDAAKRACSDLMIKVSALITAGCFISVEGFTSSSDKVNIMIAQLLNLLKISKDSPLDTQLWVRGLISEVASMTNKWLVAEEVLIEGLKEKPNDTYLLSIYADLLLKQNRLKACVSLLKPYIEQTTLLVRYLAANDRLSQVDSSFPEENYLESRIREDEVKSDERHLREYAYYQLYVKKDYSTALRNALTNWNNQKELIDSLILYRAAFKLKDQASLKLLSDWKEQNHVQINFDSQALKI